MQPDPNPILAAASNTSDPSHPSDASGSLILTPDARAFLCHHRPELATIFLDSGEWSSIAISELLRPALHPPPESFSPPNSQPQLALHAPAARGAGDLLADVLHRLGITAAAALLSRRGLLAPCRCAARQALLNKVTPRLRALIDPWPVTAITLLSWLLFLALLLAL
jgi:hypothetical protein